MPKIRGQIRKEKGEAFKRIEGEGVKEEQMANLNSQLIMLDSIPIIQSGIVYT